MGGARAVSKKRFGLPDRGTRLVLDIDGMDDEGRGRGVVVGPRGSAGYDVAVRGGLPGDRVECVVERVFGGRRLLLTRAVRWLEESPVRTESACEHVLPCVGCPLGAMEYGAQLALKRARVEQALAEADLAIECEDVTPALAAFGLRQKVKLVVGGRKGRLKLGLYRPYSHVIVGCARCGAHREALRDAGERLERVLTEAGAAPAFEEDGGLKAVVLREMEEGVGAVVLATGRLDDQVWQAVSALVDEGELASVAERVDSLGGNSLVGGHTERVRGELTLTPLDGGPRVPVDAFCQPDPEGAAGMYARVAEFVAGAPAGWVLDAYAGTGGFARAVLWDGERDVVCVERARACVDALGALDVRVLERDVADAMDELEAGAPPAAVVADPPRKGLHDDGARLAALGAARFALVSCDPDAMARDLGVLRAAGYAVERVWPVDLFPGTPEVEVVTLLTREPE